MLEVGQVIQRTGLHCPAAIMIKESLVSLYLAYSFRFGVLTDSVRTVTGLRLDGVLVLVLLILVRVALLSTHPLTLLFLFFQRLR